MDTVRMCRTQYVCGGNLAAPGSDQCTVCRALQRPTTKRVLAALFIRIRGVVVRDDYQDAGELEFSRVFDTTGELVAT